MSLIGRAWWSFSLFSFFAYFTRTGLVFSSQCEVCYIQAHHLPGFDEKAVSDFPLASQGGFLKLWQCTRMCSEDTRCRSYRFNNLTGVCSTYGVGYSLPGNTFNPVTMETGSKLYLGCHRGSSFGQQCTLTSDCVFPKSFCKDGVCECALGYRYNAVAGSCVDRCSHYGDFFASFTDHGVYGCNTNAKHTASPRECMEACRDQTIFVCTNVEYERSSGLCNMCDTVWFDLDIGQRATNDVGWNLYYRHCVY